MRKTISRGGTLTLALATIGLMACTSSSETRRPSDSSSSSSGSSSSGGNVSNTTQIAVCTFEVGVDYPLNDVGAPVQGGGDPEQCCQHAYDQGERYFQTTVFDECFLKTDLPASSRVEGQDPAYVAGTVHICEIERGVDYPLNDLEPPLDGGGAGDPAACCLHAVQSGATLFQTTDFDECYLKAARPAEDRIEGLGSGYVAGTVLD